jgi:hypothetical protein
MNWSARGNVLNQYFRNTSIETTVSCIIDYIPVNKIMGCFLHSDKNWMFYTKIGVNE